MHKPVEFKKSFARSRFTDVLDEPITRNLCPIHGYESLPLVSLEEAVAPVAHLFDSLNGYVYQAKQDCKHPANGLTQDEAAAIQLYTMEFCTEPSFYRALNRALRGENRNALKPWFLFLKLFLTGLYKIPPDSRTVWRGLRDINLSSQYPAGKKFVWWAVNSCTKNIDVLKSPNFLGQNGTRTLFSVECRAGRPVGLYSYLKNQEEEIIVLPGTFFEVVGQLNETSGLSIIQVKEVDAPIQFVKAPYPIKSIPAVKPLLNPNGPGSTPSNPKMYPSPSPIPMKSDSHHKHEHPQTFEHKKHLSEKKYHSDHSGKSKTPKDSSKHSSNGNHSDDQGKESKKELPAFKKLTNESLHNSFHHSSSSIKTESTSKSLPVQPSPIPTPSPMPMPMPVSLGPNEIFASGPWWNNWFQDGWHGTFPHMMNFNPHNNTVQGQGVDDVAQFTISGTFSPNALQMMIVQSYVLGTGNPRLNHGHQGQCLMNWNSNKRIFEGEILLLKPTGLVNVGAILEMWPAHIPRA